MQEILLKFRDFYFLLNTSSANSYYFWIGKLMRAIQVTSHLVNPEFQA